MKKSETKSLRAVRGGFDEKLQGYSTLSAAALATVAMGAPTASAQIVDLNFGGSPPSVTVASLGAGGAGSHSNAVSANVIFSGAVNLIAKQSNTHFANIFQAQGTIEIGSLNGLRFATTGGGVAKKFAAGAANTIKGGFFGATPGFFRTHSTNTHSFRIGRNGADNFQPPGTGTQHRATGYAGFKLQHDRQTYYGWLHLTVGKDANGRPNFLAITPGPETGIDGAFNETPSGAIYAGEVSAIPEPASLPIGLALFALGAAGVQEFRRRRTLAQA